MKKLSILNAFRRTDLDVIEMYGSIGDEFVGVFDIPSFSSVYMLKVIASNGDGWDHVSVSLPNRCPNWAEMEHVKHLFFKDHETAMQLHVPASDHINCHPYCLHLWRPHNVEIPRPPSIMVGITESSSNG